MIGAPNHTQVIDFSAQQLKSGKARITIDSWSIKNPKIKTWKRTDKRPRRRVKRSK